MTKYIFYGNAAQASTHAGYSTNAAQQIGAENLRKPVILSPTNRQVFIEDKPLLERSRRPTKQVAFMWEEFFIEKFQKSAYPCGLQT